MNESPFPATDLPNEPTPVLPGTLEVLERTQIDIQIATAKRYPRSLSKFKAELMSAATMDEDTAAGCFFTLTRGGKSIQGASIRLAEFALTYYGNMRVGTRIVETVPTGPTPHVVVQSVAFDLERNVMVTLEKRRPLYKKRAKPAVDEDDVQFGTAACSAIAYRDAVLKVAPRAIVNTVLAACIKVAVGDLKSLSAKRAKVFERLGKMGISADRILAVVECPKIEDVGAEQLGILIGLGTALKDGETTVEEAFPPTVAVPKKPAFEKAAAPAEPPDDVPMGEPTAAEEYLPDERPPARKTTPSKPEIVSEGGAPVLSPAHVELKAFLDEHGIGFPALQAWALEIGWEAGFDSYGSIVDLPPRSVQRLLRATTGLLKAFPGVEEVTT